MERNDVMAAARAAFEREGITEVSDDFRLAEVDSITRWVVARAVEQTTNHLIPDAVIRDAVTVADLVDAALPHVSDDAEAPLSLDDLRSALNG